MFADLTLPKNNLMKRRFLTAYTRAGGTSAPAAPSVLVPLPAQVNNLPYITTTALVICVEITVVNFTRCDFYVVTLHSFRQLITGEREVGMSLSIGILSTMTLVTLKVLIIPLLLPIGGSANMRSRYNQ